MPGCRGTHGADTRERLKHKRLKKQCDEEAALLCSSWEMERMVKDNKELKAFSEAHKMSAKASDDRANALAKLKKDKLVEQCLEHYERWVSVTDLQGNEYAGIVSSIDEMHVVLWKPDDTKDKPVNHIDIIKLSQLLEVRGMGLDCEGDSDCQVPGIVAANRRIVALTKELSKTEFANLYEKAWKKVEDVNAGLALLQKNEEEANKESEVQVYCDGNTMLM